MTAATDIAALLDQFKDKPRISLACRTPADEAPGPTPSPATKPPTAPPGDKLLAERLAPPTDIRADHDLFWGVRGYLIAEFRPATFTASALVDSLAGDYVQLTRVRRMIELRHQPPTDPVEADLAEKVITARDLLASVQQALVRCGSDLAPLCDPAGVERLASAIADRAMGLLERNGSTASTDAEPADEIDPDEGWVQSIEGEPITAGTLARLGDVTQVTALLVNPTPADRKLVWQMVTNMAYRCRGFLQIYEGQLQALRQQAAAHLAELAQNPEPVMALQQHAVEIEQAIERQVRQLRRR